MASILRFFGACIFLPFIGLYSFVLGPILKLVLIPGGLLLLLLISKGVSFETFFPGKNFKEFGLGVFSVCTNILFI